MRLHAKPGLIVAVVASLFLLTALIWSLGTDSATANNCSGGFHFHEPNTCHKHCHNGMSTHNTTHGDDCTVSNPTPSPRRERSNPVSDSVSNPAPKQAPLPCPVAVQGFQVDSGAESITDSSIKMTWNTPGPSSLHGYKIESCSSADADCPDATEVATPSQSVTSHTLTELDPNTSYFFRITALADPNSDTCSDTEASAIVTATTAKIRLVVDNFRATDITSTTMTLRWDAPESTTGLDKYKIERCWSTDPGCTLGRHVVTLDNTATSYNLTDLYGSTTYYYRITALAVSDSDYQDSDPAASRGSTSDGSDSDGETSSGMVEANTALAAPHDLQTLECAGDQATLWWVLPALWHRDVAHYSLQVCSDAACANIVATHQVTWNWGQFDAPSLSPNTTYYFRMQSIGKNGWLDSDWSETVSCTTAKQPLPAITGFTVGNNGGDSDGVPLTWDSITHTAFDKYRLEVCSGDCSTSVGYDVTETSYTHACASNSTCHYRVRAKAVTTSDYLDGPWSGRVSVWIPE